MGVIFFIISGFIGVQVGSSASFGAGIATFFGVWMLLWAISGYMRGANAAERARNPMGLVFTMEEGVDLMQKATYLVHHKALSRAQANRIEKDLGKAKIRNPRPLRPNEYTPPVTKLDVDYADAAMRTLFRSRFLYEGEAEQIEGILEPKLDEIRDEFSDLQSSGNRYDDAVRAAAEALR